MDNNKKKALISAVTIVIMLFMTLASVITFLPGSMGFIEVMRKILIFTSLTILGVVLMFLFIKSSTSNSSALKKGPRTVCVVMGVLCIIVGVINVYNGTRGLLAGLQTVSVERYELYSPTSMRGIKEYYIRTIINGELTKISVDHSTFEGLKNSEGALSISYYPYINVADEVIVNVK